jgi:hypothetical protein
MLGKNVGLVVRLLDDPTYALFRIPGDAAPPVEDPVYGSDGNIRSPGDFFYC